MEVTQMSINRWIDKKIVKYTCNEILFSLTNEGTSVMVKFNMDETWGL